MVGQVIGLGMVSNEWTRWSFAFHQKGVTETFFFFTLGPGDMQLSGDNLYVDLLCRPAADNAIAFFNALAEFAYDMETQPCLMYFSLSIYIYIYAVVDCRLCLSPGFSASQGTNAFRHPISWDLWRGLFIWSGAVMCRGWRVIFSSRFRRSILEFQYHFDGLELRQWMCSLCSSSQGLGQSHQWSCRIKHPDYSGRWPWHLRHLHEEHKHDQRNPKGELPFEDNDLEKTEEIKDAYTPRLWKKTGTTDWREKAYSKTRQLWHFFKKEGLQCDVYQDERLFWECLYIVKKMFSEARLPC